MNLNRFGGMSGVVLTAIIVLASIYIFWKQFAPEASKEYPDIQDIDPMPGFVPKGELYEGRPKLPYK